MITLFGGGEMNWIYPDNTWYMLPPDPDRFPCYCMWIYASYTFEAEDPISVVVC